MDLRHINWENCLHLYLNLIFLITDFGVLTSLLVIVILRLTFVTILSQLQILRLYIKLKKGNCNFLFHNSEKEIKNGET